MVWIKNVGMKAVHVCDSCGHGYLDVRTALACETHCGKLGAHSPLISKKAVYQP